MSCVGCGRTVDATPVGPSRALCPACQTKLVAGDSAIEAALAPEIIDERPSDAFLRQDRDADPVDALYGYRR